MIIEKCEINDGNTIDTDICIIGSGPAGISVALELLDSKKRVVVLSGGARRETGFNQKLNTGIIAAGTTHEPLEANRRRQFGGSSVAWGGRCIPFEPIDFEKRSWVNESGWPISYDELLPYYKKAIKLAKIGEFKFIATDNKEIIPDMDSEYLTSTSIERWSPPVNFGKEYEPILKSSRNIKVYINAHALKIHTSIEPDNVSHLEVFMNGRRFNVSAAKFILAAGGLENPRILLSSNSSNHPEGIGNKYDNVGRYYMSHVGGVYAEVCFKNPKNIITGYERDSEGIYFRRRWWVTERTQREYGLNNIIFYLDHPNGSSEHLGPLYSSVILSKSFLSVVRQKSFNKAKNKMEEVSSLLKKHSSNILFNGLKQAPDILAKTLKRIPKRRIPSILPPKNTKYWGIFFQTEQTPNKESRLSISRKEIDSLGTPRIIVSMKSNPGDIESVIKAHKFFISHFQKSGSGTISCSEDGLRNCLEILFKSSFNSGSHHIGTTRMSLSETNGVVDENSKVHGIKNLYIAGSSVFPTGGHANPTLTIIAQSLRLADYLKKNINK